MAELIGAETNMVTPTEADLISKFEQVVYNIEQPVYTLHACGKLILSERVRQLGYKVLFCSCPIPLYFSNFRRWS